MPSNINKKKRKVPTDLPTDWLKTSLKDKKKVKKIFMEDKDNSR